MTQRDARYWERQRKGAIVVVVMAFVGGCLYLSWVPFTYRYADRIPAKSIADEYRRRALWNVAVGVAMLAGGVGFLFYARRARRKARILRNECLGCGYNLKALPEPRCPECGTAFNPNDYPGLSAPRPERHSQ